MFAAEFLTPSAEITPLLPARLDFKKLGELSTQWGVSVVSLLRRCKEVGTVSEATYRRSHQRLATLRTSGLFARESVQGYTEEVLALLRAAFEMAEANGTSLTNLAAELRITLPRLRLLLG
ncbi:ImmA/IrrE family metallo-endopeptidase [Rhodococcus sp. 5A-K4]|jgi:Zn-dependent peptidase ImmA (M78 family)|uniref:ImmA/IrrE family metallo-endopeptidase n=1 Tax=Rhodococcus sp. 5A-K4 TaxID=3384442 RepID=UPI0038D45A2F